MARYYITTAIDYSNGEPHLGHAFEKIGADVIARYRRSLGDEVHFVIGMDEHGQKVAQEAAARGMEPQAWVDEVAGAFRRAWDLLEISHDDFIRTTEERHHRGVRALLERIREAGDFYPATYAGYYCAGCEAFKKEEELESGRCPVHPGREIEWTEEENWFFRLSGYRDRLLAHIRDHPEFVRPDSRRNEILRLLEAGLEDISASRARLPWGVPFPGTEDHTAYVWFDALPNYITAIGFPEEAFREWWPARLHVIGKDITRFHCVIWPAMLLSAGLDLPETVWAHGFVNVSGVKLSKSAGTELDLTALAERHGPDALRYFLVREVPWDGDRDFSTGDEFLEQLDRRYEADLANDLGNLLNRVVSMVERYRDGVVPSGAPTRLDETRREVAADYRRRMDAGLLHEGAAAVFRLVRAANGFVDESRPWQLAKEEKAGAGGGSGGGGGDGGGGNGESGDGGAALDDVLASLLRALAACATMLSPFMPRKAAELWRTIGGEGPVPGVDAAPEPPAGAPRVRPGPVLFPRAPEPEGEGGDVSSRA